MPSNPRPATTAPSTWRQGSGSLASASLFWLCRRALASAAVLLIVTVVVFLVTQALPSDPARVILGEMARPEAIADLRETLGLNRSLPVQYASWLLNLLRGDFGQSFAAAIPVGTLLVPALLNSLVLIAIATILSAPLAVLIGIAAAIERDKAFDHFADYVLLGLSSIPEFAKGILLVLLLAAGAWRLLPATALIPPGDWPLQHPREMVLPVLVLVLSALPYLSRLVRSSMIDALNAEYVQMARLKGLSERRVVLHHALPNTAVPVIQGIAISTSLMLGGSVVIENLFRFPGIGALMTDAMSSRDLPLIQALIVTFATTYMLINLTAEVFILLANPELRSKTR